MKKYLFLSLFLSFCFSAVLSAQIPGMRYQAIARDMNGQVLAGQRISLQIRLLADAPQGEAVYTELHSVQTNELGLFDLVVGEGQVVSGDFQKIPWSRENIWMEISLDERGGKRFTPLQSSRLLAVPYAFHAGSAGSIALDEPLEKVGDCQPTGLPFWTTIGNNNVNADCHYIGTRNFVDLVFKTNGEERMRMLAGGGIIFSTDVNFKGNVEIEGNLKVGKNTDIGLDLSVGQNGSFGNNVTVNNNVDIGNDLTVNNDVTVGNNLTVEGKGTFYDLDVEHNLSVGNDAKVDRDLNIARDAAVARNLSITGTTTAAGQLNANGRLVVTGGASGSDGNPNSYPVLVQGSNQGIAVKVNGSRNNDNNFISFWDDNGMQGRIEGQTALELATSPEYIVQTAILAAEVGMATADLVGASTSGNACGGAGAVACPPIASLIAAAAANEAVAIANLAAYQAFAFDNVGITYESGAGDYAEWLERRFPEELLSPGDIVGVAGGKITRFTKHAEKFMVVSTKPAVLGNMPDPGEERLYNKVAFLGQIPVKVRGPVNVGDYILPSGQNDGTGKAVAPDALTPEQYQQIVGISWSEFDGEGAVGLVNLAVGLNANDVARLAVQQEKRITQLEQELRNTQAALKELLPEFTAMKERMDALENRSSAPLREAEPAINAETWADQVRPATLDPSLIEESLLLAEQNLRLHGVDVDQNPALKRMFEDQDYRRDLIRQILDRYEAMKAYMDAVDSRQH